MRRGSRKRLKEEDILQGNNVCRLCREEPDEELFGKFFVEEESGFSVHQYCMFFSSGLAQYGEDDEGFDGFLIKDIKKEISRAKRLRCSFCRKPGATIGCCDGKCHQTFHYKCGRERGSLFQFFDSFNSYCLFHRPTQCVNLAQSRSQTCPICLCEIQWDSRTSLAEVPLVTPCCKKSWFHNSCLQRHAHSSGLHFFRCPVCNEKEKFQEEMRRMGIFIPEQDASWEKGDAFADLLFQYRRCDAQKCICSHGRDHAGTAGKWRIRLCDLCGQFGTHLKCQHWKRWPLEWHCNVCGNTLPYSSTRQRPMGDCSMDPYTSDGGEESSSADDCEVNVCSVSDNDDVPLASLKKDVEKLFHPRSSVEEHMKEEAASLVRTRRQQMLQLRNSVDDCTEEGAFLLGKCQPEPLQPQSSIEEHFKGGTASPMRKRRQDSWQLGSGTEQAVKKKSSPMRKRRRLSLQGSPERAEIGNHILRSQTTASSINDLLDSTSMTSSVLLVYADAARTVLGGAMATEGTSDTTTVKRDSEAILIRDSDSEYSSDASVEVLAINTATDQRKESTTCKSDDASSTSSEAFDAARMKSPMTKKQNLAKLKKLSLNNITKAEADSSNTFLPVKDAGVDRESGVNLLDFESKQEPSNGDDDVCLITKVVKKPCPLGNDKFGKCFLRCCNPVGYFYPDVMATSSKGTHCTCKDLQIKSVSSTSCCSHVQGKSDKNQEPNLPSAKTTTATEDDISRELCTVGTNTLPFKPSERKGITSKQSLIMQTYFPKGKRPVSPPGQNKRLNLRSKKNGSYLERSLKKFYSLREHHMTVSHKCFR